MDSSRAWPFPGFRMVRMVVVRVRPSGIFSTMRRSETPGGRGFCADVDVAELECGGASFSEAVAPAAGGATGIALRTSTRVGGEACVTSAAGGRLRATGGEAGSSSLPRVRAVAAGERSGGVDCGSAVAGESGAVRAGPRLTATTPGGASGTRWRTLAGRAGLSSLADDITVWGRAVVTEFEFITGGWRTVVTGFGAGGSGTEEAAGAVAALIVPAEVGAEIGWGAADVAAGAGTAAMVGAGSGWVRQDPRGTLETGRSIS